MTEERNSDAKLRDEILSTERSQADFLKWKLVLVAGIGSAALGLQSSVQSPYSFYILSLIPFVCAYVDLVYTHLMLRIVVIGTYLRKTEPFQAPGGVISYESFVERARGPLFHPYALEALALHASTLLLSIAIGLLGALGNCGGVAQLFPALGGHSGLPLVLSGCSGLALTVVVLVIRRRQLHAIATISTT